MESLNVIVMLGQPWDKSQVILQQLPLDVSIFYPSIYLSVYLSLSNLYIYLCDAWSTLGQVSSDNATVTIGCKYLSINLYIHLSINTSIYLFLYLYPNQSIYHCDA